MILPWILRSGSNHRPHTHTHTHLTDNELAQETPPENEHVSFGAISQKFRQTELPNFSFPTCIAIADVLGLRNGGEEDAGEGCAVF